MLRRPGGLRARRPRHPRDRALLRCLCIVSFRADASPQPAGADQRLCAVPGERLRGSTRKSEREEEANMGERLIEANGVELCTEPFGDPGDPPILLIMGVNASMLWWEEGFCELLAEGGRFVIRYDHRDTGRSVI